MMRPLWQIGAPLLLAAAALGSHADAVPDSSLQDVAPRGLSDALDAHSEMSESTLSSRGWYDGGVLVPTLVRRARYPRIDPKDPWKGCDAEARKVIENNTSDAEVLARVPKEDRLLVAWVNDSLVPGAWKNNVVADDHKRVVGLQWEAMLNHTGARDGFTYSCQKKKWIPFKTLIRDSAFQGTTVKNAICNATQGHYKGPGTAQQFLDLVVKKLGDDEVKLAQSVRDMPSIRDDFRAVVGFGTPKGKKRPIDDIPLYVAFSANINDRIRRELKRHKDYTFGFRQCDDPWAVESIRPKKLPQTSKWKVGRSWDVRPILRAYKDADDLAKLANRDDATPGDKPGGLSLSRRDVAPPEGAASNATRKCRVPDHVPPPDHKRFPDAKYFDYDCDAHEWRPAAEPPKLHGLPPGWSDYCRPPTSVHMKNISQSDDDYLKELSDEERKQAEAARLKYPLSWREFAYNATERKSPEWDSGDPVWKLYHAGKLTKHHHYRYWNCKTNKWTPLKRGPEVEAVKPPTIRKRDFTSTLSRRGLFSSKPAGGKKPCRVPDHVPPPDREKFGNAANWDFDCDAGGWRPTTGPPTFPQGTGLPPGMKDFCRPPQGIQTKDLYQTDKEYLKGLKFRERFHARVGKLRYPNSWRDFAYNPDERRSPTWQSGDPVWKLRHAGKLTPDHRYWNCQENKWTPLKEGPKAEPVPKEYRPVTAPFQKRSIVGDETSEYSKPPTTIRKRDLATPTNQAPPVPTGIPIGWTDWCRSPEGVQTKDVFKSDHDYLHELKFRDRLRARIGKWRYPLSWREYGYSTQERQTSDWKNRDPVWKTHHVGRRSKDNRYWNCKTNKWTPLKQGPKVESGLTADQLWMPAGQTLRPADQARTPDNSASPTLSRRDVAETQPKPAKKCRVPDHVPPPDWKKYGQESYYEYDCNAGAYRPTTGPPKIHPATNNGIPPGWKDFCKPPMGVQTKDIYQTDHEYLKDLSVHDRVHAEIGKLKYPKSWRDFGYNKQERQSPNWQSGDPVWKLHHAGKLTKDTKYWNCHTNSFKGLKDGPKVDPVPEEFKPVAAPFKKVDAVDKGPSLSRRSLPQCSPPDRVRMPDNTTDDAYLANLSTQDRADAEKAKRVFRYSWRQFAYAKDEQRSPINHGVEVWRLYAQGKLPGKGDEYFYWDCRTNAWRSPATRRLSSDGQCQPPKDVKVADNTTDATYLSKLSTQDRADARYARRVFHLSWRNFAYTDEEKRSPANRGVEVWRLFTQGKLAGGGAKRYSYWDCRTKAWRTLPRIRPRRTGTNDRGGVCHPPEGVRLAVNTTDAEYLRTLSPADRGSAEKARELFRYSWRSLAYTSDEKKSVSARRQGTAGTEVWKLFAQGKLPGKGDEYFFWDCGRNRWRAVSTKRRPGKDRTELARRSSSTPVDGGGGE